MTTILAIDDKLIREAKELGKHKTKKDAVTDALREYIKKRKQLKIIEIFGKVDYDPSYDYKKARNR